MELPQEYWRERTLKEIASAVGTPIDIDGPTRNRTYGHYARILVDIDLSKKAYDEVLVERDGFAFNVEIQYEQRPLFCHHCYSIGHNIATCRWLNPQVAKEKVDRGKQLANETVIAPPISRQLKDGGGATSAIGGNGSWIPISVNSTVTTTTRTTVPAPQTTHATSILIPVNTLTQSILVSLHVMPVSDISSNSFSFPLQNGFDCISYDELALPRPVLEVIYLIAHDDVQPVEVRRSHQTSREVLENPSVTDVEFQDHSENFIDRDSDARPFDPPVATLDISDGSLVGVDVIEISSQVGVAQHVVTSIHSNARIQQDLELWRRVKEYDKKSAEMPFIPVLTRKQKQHLKKTTSGKPYITRSTGDNSTSNQ